MERSDRINVLERETAHGRKLNEALRAGNYDVIHYAGHAKFNESDADLSALVLHGEELFFGQKIRRLLEGRPLVFLNACDSGRTANELEPQEVSRYLQKPAEGLASSFIYGALLAVSALCGRSMTIQPLNLPWSFTPKFLKGT